MNAGTDRPSSAGVPGRWRTIKSQSCNVPEPWDGASTPIALATESQLSNGVPDLVPDLGVENSPGDEIRRSISSSQLAEDTRFELVRA